MSTSDKIKSPCFQSLQTHSEDILWLSEPVETLKRKETQIFFWGGDLLQISPQKDKDRKVIAFP